MKGIGLVLSSALICGTAVISSPSRAAAEEERFAGAVGRVARNYLMHGEVSTFLFRLDDAYFTTRYVSGSETAVASRGEKLMVLRYTVLNQDNHKVEYGPNTVQFAAKGKDRAYTISSAPMDLIGRDNDEIAPGASKTDIVWFEVPSSEQEMRLNVRVGSSAELGYDLRSQVRPPTGPYVDDKSKVVLDEIEVRPNQLAPIGLYDAAVESITPQRGQILDGFLPGSGDVFYLVQVRYTNQTHQPLSLETYSITPELLDKDGKQIEWTRAMVGAKSSQHYASVLAPGKSDVVRYVFRPKAGQVADFVRLYDTTSGRRSLCVKF
jgi:hypothetical protein